MKKILLMFFAAYALHTTSIQSLAQIELTIKMTPMPAITLSGPSGEYQIQRAQVLGNVTKWITITNVALSGNPFVLFDTVAGSSQQYYQAVQQTSFTNPNPQLLAWIPPGTFTMGSPSTEKGRYSDEGPQTRVTISKGFWMSKYEVTQKEYKAVMGSNPSYFVEDNNPVEQISWYDATNYCGILTAQERTAGRLPTGYIYRLPTEAEWEFACRAGTTTRFSYGDDLNYTSLGNYAWYYSNSSSKTHPVGQKQTNAWGLYDMDGNVWEWCLDWYSESLPGGSVTDPKGSSSGSSHVLRGGGWNGYGGDCRSANRSGGAPDYWYYDIGFRPVLAQEIVGPIPIMAWIPPGTFTMGSPETEKDRSIDEGPQTRVTISRGFWMGKYEVTQKEYQAVMGSNPSYFTGDLNRPVEQVSWYRATNYCGKLTQQELAAGRLPTGYIYRLPTEAEWEYACRAGTTTRFSYGDDLNYTSLGNYAWCWDNSWYSTKPSGVSYEYSSGKYYTTHPVGQKLPNPWGLYDMHGNVYEWCSDWRGRYPGGSVTDPRGSSTGSYRVERGGSWYFSAGFCRSADHYGDTPDGGYYYVGFRPVLALGQ